MENKKIHQQICADAVYYALKEKDAQISIETEPFEQEEYACDCHGEYCNGFPVAINRTLLDKIELLQRTIEKPIIIVSGVRCEQQNIKIDGSPLSFHKLGRAVDVKCEGYTVDMLSDIAESIGLSVIRDYKENVVHCQWND